jgi:hypothetical protein
MIIEITERCRCGSFLSLFEDNGRWVCSCMQRCYDPSVEDPTPIESLYGRGETPADALADYLRLREDADLEPVYVPTDLGSFVVPSHPGRFLVVGPMSGQTWSFPTLAYAEQLQAPIYFEPTLAQKAANQ